MAGSTGTSAVSENPFSAHRIRPGVIPYLFSDTDDANDPARLDQLIDSWRASSYVGQIVGAHGCGKTTLACSIARRAVENQQLPFDGARSLTIRSTPLVQTDSALSWVTNLLRLRSANVTFGNSLIPDDRNASLPVAHNSRSTETILVIDGIERLTLLQQAVMFHSLKRLRVPTLFTTHHVSKTLPLLGGRCPVLFRACSDVRVFAKIVDLMTQPSQRLDRAVVENAFDSCRGNVREALMKLYDTFDSRKSD